MDFLPRFGNLDHVVDRSAALVHDAHRHQATLGVAAVARFDLDDLCAPLGKHRAGGGHERPGGDFQHTYTVQNSVNANLCPPSMRA